MSYVSLVRQKNSKSLWSIINQLERGPAGALRNMVTEVKWVEHISKLYQNPNADEPLSSTPSGALPLNFTEQMIEARLRACRRSGAPGPYGLPAALFKNDQIYRSSQLGRINKICLKENKAPDSWKGAIVHPMYKKGPYRNSDSYCMITLLNKVAKIVAGPLLEEVESWAMKTNLIPLNQTGFCQTSSTVDNLAALAMLTEKNTRKKLYLYTCIVDPTKAFDSVNRNCLWRKLAEWNIPSNLLKAIPLLYSDN